MATISTLIMSCFTHQPLTDLLCVGFLLKARHIKGLHIFPRRGDRSFGCNTDSTMCPILWEMVCQCVYLLYVFTHMPMCSVCDFYTLRVQVLKKRIFKTICELIIICGYERAIRMHVYLHTTMLTNCIVTAYLRMSVSISKTCVLVMCVCVRLCV